MPSLDALEEGLVIVDRGNRSEIGTFEGRSFDSKFSGNVIELCPVGALTAKTGLANGRPTVSAPFVFGFLGLAMVAVGLIGNLLQSITNLELLGTLFKRLDVFNTSAPLTGDFFR